MQLPLKYGYTSLALELDTSLHVELLTSGRPCPADEEAALLLGALQNPIGSLPLAKRVASGQRVAVVTSDITRPCPSARMLPPVLDELNRGGVRDENILVVFALRTHRRHTEAEKIELAGVQVYRRVRCMDSDPTDCVLLGQTSCQTPVWVFRPMVQADVRACLGNIEYHCFAGYSGGVKAVIPGVANAETIQHNHRRMTEPGALAAHLDNNPVRSDIEEAGEIVGVHLILNVILDEKKTIVSVVAGHPRRAHRAGCRQGDAFGRPAIDQLADVVIVIAGGMENMSLAPFALKKARYGYRMERGELLDLMVYDGLQDAYSGKHAVEIADENAARHNLSREVQDEFAIRSYRLAQQAVKEGVFKDEINPVMKKGRKGDEVWVADDEGPFTVDFNKLRQSRPAFRKEGTITAGNASTVNDGAAMTLLANADAMKTHNLEPRARLVASASFSTKPELFPEAPVEAIEAVCTKARVPLAGIDLIETSEAFAAVPLIAINALKLDPERVNVNGGTMAIGHPIGASGSRLAATVIRELTRGKPDLGWSPCASAEARPSLPSSSGSSGCWQGMTGEIVF